uniref:C2H2-type domain-containing protein n=1 Tax=Oryzias melastigma TaxID=30732 RepID=A0A3B3CC77_ORYME
MCTRLHSEHNIPVARLILSCICVLAVLPQHWLIKEEDLCNQQRNFRVAQNDPEPTQTKEELGEPELQQREEEQEEREPQQTEEKEEPQTIQIKETYTLMEISTFEGHPQNRDQSKRRDRSHVKSVGGSHSQCDFNVQDKFKKTTLVKKTKQSPKEKRLVHIKSGKGTRTAHNMSANMKTKSDEGPYVCKECGKNVGSWFKFRTHITTHTREKTFSCKECDKHFSLLSSLKTHMRTHRGEKPLYELFTCKECDRSFSRIYNLKSHMSTHTGEKPFTCKECDRSFRRVSNLKKHVNIHRGEKPFTCQECDRSFSQISNLKSHMRTHTGEKAVPRATTILAADLDVAGQLTARSNAGQPGQ